MKKLVVVTATLQIVLASSAWAVDLSRYINQDLNASIDGYTLLEVPEVKQNFVKTFGVARYKQLSETGRGRGIRRLDDPELGSLIVTSQCRMGGCDYTSAVIMRVNGAMVGLCLAKPESGTSTAAVEWSGRGWSKKGTANDMTVACRRDTPEAEVAEFKAWQARRK